MSAPLLCHCLALTARYPLALALPRLGKVEQKIHDPQHATLVATTEHQKVLS